MSAADPTPAGMVDLAAERVGGKALSANDEFFAEKENLLKPGRGVFIPDKYTDRGKWMDGWETRRRRTPGHDWCVIQLGLRGVVRQVDIDTNHFLGNHPPFASLEAACLTNGEVDGRRLDGDSAEIAAQSRVAKSLRDRERRNRGRISGLILSPTAAWRVCAFTAWSCPIGASEAGRTDRSGGGREWRRSAGLQRHVLQLDEQPDHARPLREHGRRLGNETAARAGPRLDYFEARARRARSRKSKSIPITSKAITPTRVRSKAALRRALRR